MELILNSEELEQKLGEALKRLRLLKNWPREELCARAGISVTALRNLETGSGATIRSLIQVVRVLGREAWLSALAPQVTINPLHMVKEGGVRQRARRTRRVR